MTIVRRKFRIKFDVFSRQNTHHFGPMKKIGEVRPKEYNKSALKIFLPYLFLITLGNLITF